ncbi:hypothetical protein FKW77_010492 [Venturia effusa]|uniref:Extracellular membrane protein CFEM domain-containing protein n=1 Tax=Venturia effusa TaxID=50376 RepID=A0A517L0I4_9PEZI|nr:hypothetical protein FKW77_010492 [Venturia effusa]
MHLSTILLPTLLTSIALAVEYPLAQPCFDESTKVAGCIEPAGNESWANFNTCACTNTGSWLANSAKCIGQKDRSHLEAIYGSLKANCEGTGTGIVFDLEMWMNAADGK